MAKVSREGQDALVLATAAMQVIALVRVRLVYPVLHCLDVRVVWDERVCLN
jgi:hypothetical protein